jgi:hypothetical protein
MNPQKIYFNILDYHWRILEHGRTNMLRHLVQAHQLSQQHRRGRHRRPLGRQISKPSQHNQSLRSAVKLDLGVVVHRGDRTDRFHLQLELAAGSHSVF